jgi:hypothetical protein
MAGFPGRGRVRIAYAVLGTLAAAAAVGDVALLRPAPSEASAPLPRPLAAAVQRLQSEPRVVVWFSDRAGTQVTRIDREARTLQVVDPKNDEVLAPWVADRHLIHQLLGACLYAPAPSGQFRRLVDAVLVGPRDTRTAFLVLTDGVLGAGEGVGAVTTSSDALGRTLLAWSAPPGLLARELRLAPVTRRYTLRLDAQGRPSLLVVTGTGAPAIATFDYPNTLPTPAPPRCEAPVGLD